MEETKEFEIVQQPIKFRFTDFINFTKEIKEYGERILVICLNESDTIKMIETKFFDTKRNTRFKVGRLISNCAGCGLINVLYFSNKHVYNCESEEINPNYPQFCEFCRNEINHAFSQLEEWSE